LGNPADTNLAEGGPATATQTIVDDTGKSASSTVTSKASITGEGAAVAEEEEEAAAVLRATSSSETSSTRGIRTPAARRAPRRPR
jgi:hypothetical protein